MEVLLHLLILVLDAAHLLPPTLPPLPAVCQLALPADATATRVQDVPPQVLAALVTAKPAHAEPPRPEQYGDPAAEQFPLCNGEQQFAGWDQTREPEWTETLDDPGVRGGKLWRLLPRHPLQEGQGAEIFRQDLGGGRLLAFVATGTDTSLAGGGALWGALVLARLDGRTLVAEAVGSFATEFETEPRFQAWRADGHWLWLRRSGELGTGGGGGGSEWGVYTEWQGHIVAAGWFPDEQWDTTGDRSVWARGKVEPGPHGVRLTVQTEHISAQESPTWTATSSRTQTFDLVLKRGQLVRKDGRKLPRFVP